MIGYGVVCSLDENAGKVIGRTDKFTDYSDEAWYAINKHCPGTHMLVRISVGDLSGNVKVMGGVTVLGIEGFGTYNA